MKHIEKHKPPGSLEQWLALGNDNWQPTYDNLQNPQKAQLQRNLLAEQGWICCYCGRSVSEEDSHIEHFRPQEHYPNLALDYGNLHASCLRMTNPGTPLHCGHAKGDKFDEDQAISPLEPDCGLQFRYTLDGQILPNSGKAVYMCNLLRLDSEFLNARREQILEGALSSEILDSATDEDLLRLQESFKRPDINGHLPNFGHVVARYIEQLRQQPNV
ncbi:MAG: TIGR02646 family protein [Betaproteobacteria bacterium]|nr:TIGR02646 family protein [Betaproteobacteria bacterium]MCL2886865.1 TIGR02646 family protein [Betaproteobacteria bacterium]